MPPGPHAASPPPVPEPRVPGDPAPRPVWWWLLLLLPLLAALAVPWLRPRPLPRALGQVPAFRLVDSAGRPFGSTDLRGQVWVADFFFTRCRTVCPRLTATMARLERRLRDAGLDDVRLVSVSVDPEHDTPERLADYVREHGIDTRGWSLLTGPPDQVRSLVVDGFHLGLGQPAQQKEGFLDIAHSAKLVLVDGEGTIRGYHEASTAGLDEVLSACRRLERAARRR